MSKFWFTAEYYYFYFINFFGKVNSGFAVKQATC